MLLIDRSVADHMRLARILDLIDLLGVNPLVVTRLTSAHSATLLDMLGEAVPHRRFEPGFLVATLDLSPTAPTSPQLRRYPGLDNGRLPVVISYLEADPCAAIDRSAPDLHFSRNRNEAWSYVSAVLPDQKTHLRDLAAARHGAFVTPFPVLRSLDGGARQRARVELVDFHGKAAVCKTFRPGQEHILQRELNALLTLRPSVSEVPEVLAYGDNWFVSPFYVDVPRRSFGGLLVSLDTAKQLVAAVEGLYRAGYAHLDLRYNNVICDPRAGLKILDFEFAYAYPTLPRTFEDSYDIAGVPQALRETPTAPGIPWQVNYRTRLEHRIGLSLASLRHDSEWKQHFLRALYVLTRTIPVRVNKFVYHRVYMPLRGHLGGWKLGGHVAGGRSQRP